MDNRQKVLTKFHLTTRSHLNSLFINNLSKILIHRPCGHQKRFNTNQLKLETPISTIHEHLIQL